MQRIVNNSSIAGYLVCKIEFAFTLFELNFLSTIPRTQTRYLLTVVKKEVI